MSASNEMSTSKPAEPVRLCLKCRDKPGTLKSRGNLLCDACYLQGIIGKVLRQMSEYRVRGKTAGPRRLMLALSMGVSSLSLLHILTTMLKHSVERMGRYGYTLDVLVMDDESAFRAPAENANGGQTRRQSKQSEAELAVYQMHDLAQLFPQSDYPMILSFAWKSTETCFNSLARSYGKSELEDMVRNLQVSGAPPSQPDSKGPRNLSSTLPDIASSSGNASDPSSSKSPSSPYREYIASLASRSAQSDANITLTRRFMVEHAKQNNCEAIIWGDSTTRLAERTLAEASKGRGTMLPWLTADGPTPFGVDFLFPLRDVLRRELVLYTDLAVTDDGRPLKASLPAQVHAQASPTSLSSAPASASSKDMTIDALMTQYFASVEVNYPAIVANVVRTANKLAPAGDAASSVLAASSPCQLCGLPVAHGTQGLHSWPGSQEGDEPLQPESEFLCYGCARTTKGRRR